MGLVKLTSTANKLNSSIWQSLYREGKNDLQYPNDVLVRLGARLFDGARDRRILDFGLGTGANLLHFASRGFEMYGIEISEHALVRAKEKLRAGGYSGDLRLMRTGEQSTFADAYFDVGYAWQVLYYNDRDDWTSMVGELERITKPGGLILVATAAPGDISQVEAEPLGNYMYRSKVSGQEGRILAIPDRRALPRFFPGRHLDVGEFGFQFGTITTRHWIISYRVEND
jgi:SAM-dependent methyltransferase